MLTKCYDGKEHEWKITEDGKWCKKCRMLIRESVNHD